MSEAVVTARIHILLVEDHAMLRGIVEQALRAAGFRVTVAETGDQAASLLEAGPCPDVLLSDIRMRGKMNGKDLARWAHRRFPALAILLQTGFGDLEASEFRILRKPFYPDALIEAIHAALEERSRH